MARIRTIKPEFFTSEDIVSLTPFARLLYIALWCEADREGRLTWKPKTFKIRYFPADSCDIDAMCSELINANLVVRFGETLAHIPSFLDHQHINPRESKSTLDAPESTRRLRVVHASARDSDAQVGTEGKEGKTDASFDAFWSAYPSKKSKGAAEKAFSKLKPNEQLLQTILSAIGRAKTSAQWMKNDGEFIPHPASWLNAKAWEDVHGSEQTTGDVFRGAL